MGDRSRAAVTWLPLLGGVAVLTVLVLWMSGVFAPRRVEPGTVDPPPGRPAPEATGTSRVERRTVWHPAVGTVSSRTTASVAPQVRGRIMRILVEEGDEVAEGELIAELAGEEYRARLEQARSAVISALAGREEASSSYDRVRRLYEQDAATEEQLEAAEARKKQADAGVEAARQQLAEAQVILSYTRIASPLDGVVARRDADPGDLAWPGRPLVVIYDPRALELEAHVPEGLVRKVEPGDELEARIEAVGLTLSATVTEVVPSADPVSRSFLVKAALPGAEAVYPGMFGRLRIPVDEREVVTVPVAAVETVGQLRTVLVARDGVWVRRHITVGKTLDGRVEVLSGIAGSERIGWDEEAVRDDG